MGVAEEPASKLAVVVGLVVVRLVVVGLVVVGLVVVTHNRGMGPEGLLGHGTQLFSPRCSWKKPFSHGVHFAIPGFAA